MLYPTQSLVVTGSPGFTSDNNNQDHTWEAER